MSNIKFNVRKIESLDSETGYEEGKVAISSSNGDLFDGEDFVIPAEIDGNTIVAIDDNAFEDVGEINKLIIPTTIEVIGENAFAKTVIQEVIFEDPMNSKCIVIQENAFSDANNKLFISPKSLYFDMDMGFEKLLLIVVNEQGIRPTNAAYSLAVLDDGSSTDNGKLNSTFYTDSERKGEFEVFKEELLEKISEQVENVEKIQLHHSDKVEVFSFNGMFWEEVNEEN